jgi:hypothetical protein
MAVLFVSIHLNWLSSLTVHQFLDFAMRGVSELSLLEPQEESDECSQQKNSCQSVTLYFKRIGSELAKTRRNPFFLFFFFLIFTFFLFSFSCNVLYKIHDGIYVFTFIREFLENFTQLHCATKSSIYTTKLLITRS